MKYLTTTVVIDTNYEKFSATIKSQERRSVYEKSNENKQEITSRGDAENV